MLDIPKILDDMTGERRAGALEMLDHISRPLSPREIERLLREKGVPKSRAVIIASAVHKFHIVAAIGGE